MESKLEKQIEYLKWEIEFKDKLLQDMWNRLDNPYTV